MWDVLELNQSLHAAGLWPWFIMKPSFLTLVVSKNCCFLLFCFYIGSLVQWILGFGVQSDGIDLHPQKEVTSLKLEPEWRNNTATCPRQVLVGPPINWTKPHSYLRRRHLGRWYPFHFVPLCLSTCYSRCEWPRWRKQPSRHQPRTTSTNPTHRNQCKVLKLEKQSGRAVSSLRFLPKVLLTIHLMHSSLHFWPRSRIYPLHITAQPIKAKQNLR